MVCACLAPWPSAEGFPVIWIHDTSKHQRDAHTRQKKIDKGVIAVDELNQRLTGPRCRLKDRPAVYAAAEAAITAAGAERWVTCTVTEHATEDFKQDHAGRPGPHTTYRKITKTRWQVTAEANHEQVRHDAATDGCYPLITNDATLSHADVWNAYHWQPHLERRHHILKGIQDATPVWLKDIGQACTEHPDAPALGCRFPVPGKGIAMCFREVPG